MVALTRTADTVPAPAAAGDDAAPAPIDLARRAPFRGRHDDAVSVEAAVRGAIPEWLRGDLVRTAPAVFARGAWRARHWFDALGALYAFRIAGSGVGLRQRLARSRVERAAAEGRSPTATFGTPITRSLWKRIFSPIPEITDNPNVNVVQLGDDPVALTESPHQWAFDRESLALTRELEYRDRLGPLAMIAHPHFDFDSGRVVSLATRLGWRSEILVFEHAPGARERTVVGRIRARRLPYLHSFGLTRRYAIVVGHPFTVDPLRLLWSNAGFVDHFAFRPEVGTTLWLVDRQTGAVREHAAPPGFVFHVANAFDEGSATSVDVAVYDDASIVKALSTDALAERGFPALTPSIVRWTVEEGVPNARAEILLERGFEFPSVSYRKRNGRRHSVAWGARLGAGAARSEIVRLDGRGERTFEEDGFVFGEPIFVARPGSDREDDGALLSVGSHREHERSAMVVLDPASLEPLAWAEVPVPIPLGFHGAFLRS